ncbi:mechanosensitive ion channel family protein [Pelagerythrobacter rhizovicinus]|uniref:Mechanosensitive ion channel n=1 Tax=Pelagerythrobacter rhizovicinus TaxID=2268576 RepID=A0A4V1QW51_9SPHN|nr:mechanosensitive ion channel domain-containing protein [Pelagerythrobacter rhizovicinus]RXZ64936.1 mechanosensitive ion channel [Pelagerythrobacter rhizovicinus]
MFERYDPRNWTIAWGEVATAIIAVGIAVVAAFVIHRIVFGLLLRLARSSQSEVDELVFARLAGPIRWSVVAIAIAAVAQTNPNIHAVWRWTAPFVVPALVGWVALALVRAFAAALQMRSELSSDPITARSRRTRVAILSRTAAFLIVLLTVAMMLLAIPGVRDVGVTLMASAGLAALAVGAAAQPALKSLIAGLQMALTEPLRIGDLVVIEGFSGRVEEIRMSFVIVRTWDERAIIVPTSTFLEKSFENWSRESERLTGPVFLHLDPAAEIAPIRAEFERFVATREEWDGRTAELLMTEAYPESIELRIAVSAATIGDLWTLRCAVREHMIEWLRINLPDALIRHRLGVDDANAAVKAND